MNEISKKQRIGVLIFLVIVSTITDFAMVGPNGFISILAPSIGVVAVYHLFYKDSFYLSLCTYFLTSLVSRIIWFEASFSFDFFIAIYKTIALYIALVLMKWLFNKLKNNGYKSMDLRDSLNFILIGVTITFVAASFNLIPIYFIFDYSNNMFWFGNLWIGYLFGFFIFGSALYYSLLFDSINVTRKEICFSFLSLITLGVVCFCLFTNSINGLDYHHFSYLFFIMYSLAAIYLSFRVVFTSNYILYILYIIFTYDSSSTFDLSTELFSIVFYLLVLTAFSVLVKHILLTLQVKEEETRNVKDSMKEMIVETSNILKNIEKISTSDKTYSNDFLIKMFRVGIQLLDKFDKASLYIRKDGRVTYIDALGYDCNFLNNLNLRDADFDWSYSKPKVIDRERELYSSVFAADETYIDEYASIKKSVRFNIMFDSHPVAGMSFDITGDNESVLNNEDLKNCNELRQMINSFYDLIVVQDSSNAFRNDIVISLVRALGLYDSYTGKHSEEVAYLSLEVAKRMKLPNQTVQRIYWSAIVHDIGKIGLDNNIVNKKGSLTKDEMLEVQKHTIFGFNILDSVKGLKDVAIRVRHHHERWDGKGYPDSLQGDEIPLCSQVLAVADAVSAMSRNRVYSSAKSLEEILSELHKGRGKQFSPSVCDVMIDYIEESRLVDYFIQTS